MFKLLIEFDSDEELRFCKSKYLASYLKTQKGDVQIICDNLIRLE